MSRSYRKLYCGVTCSGEHLGEKSDKQHAHRATRHVNKALTIEAGRTEDNEPTRPYRCKKSVEVWDFRKDGKLAVDPTWTSSKFHFKRIAKGKVRMSK